MFYTIYKITNQINGKFYIGSHKTKDLNDDYMGSGKYLKRAQEKYGVENFTKEILFVFDNPEDMYAKEAEIVTVDFIAEENTYNIKVGGFGGFDYVNANGLNIMWKDPKARAELTSKTLKQRWQDTPESFSDEFRRNAGTRSESFISANLKGTFRGKSHTEEAKAAIAAKNSVHQKGENNSQYGTRWVHSLELQQSKKIRATDPLPDGWLEGRKIRF